jgi:Family of unknown function (DUF6522)
MQVERRQDGFCVDASMLAGLLKVPPREVHELMRAGEITSICERGEGEHAGCYRLTFFCGSRRVRLDLDESGRVLRRTVIDFGDRPLPAALHGTGGPTTAP